MVAVDWSVTWGSFQDADSGCSRFILYTTFPYREYLWCWEASICFFAGQSQRSQKTLFIVYFVKHLIIIYVLLSGQVLNNVSLQYLRKWCLDKNNRIHVIITLP